MCMARSLRSITIFFASLTEMKLIHRIDRVSIRSTRNKK
jgi:hypothetical protein